MGAAEPKWEHEWVDSQERLEQVGKALVSKKLLSIDTETAGWQTGNERLCLIQIGIPDESRVIVIDALALPTLTPLEPALSATTPELIAHNAQFEERQLGRHGIKLRGMIDTLTMARKLRPDLPTHSLQSCCRHLLQIEISKSEQTSDWSVRPLSKSQLLYACLDAEIAYQLYCALHELEKRLTVDPKLKVPDLMEALVKTVREKMALTREIAPELSFLTTREEMLRDAVRTQLVHGADPYDGEFGSCKVQRVKRTEIDPGRVRELLPELAPLVISEYVERQRLIAVLKEHGADADAVEKVTNIVGYNDRLYLDLPDL